MQQSTRLQMIVNLQLQERFWHTQKEWSFYSFDVALNQIPAHATNVKLVMGQQKSEI